MRKIILFSIFILLFTCSAWSLTINTVTDVGSIDTILGYRTVTGSSDPIEEQNWVNSIVEPDINFSGKTDFEQEGYNLLVLCDGTTDTYALEFKSVDPGYFLIKTGAIVIGYDDQGKAIKDQFDILFQNIDSPMYGVLDLSDITAFIGAQVAPFEITSIEKISHLSEFGGAPVPEPTTLLLLGSGLLGLAGFRRKIKK